MLQMKGVATEPVSVAVTLYTRIKGRRRFDQILTNAVRIVIGGFQSFLLVFRSKTWDSTSIMPRPPPFESFLVQ